MNIQATEQMKFKANCNWSFHNDHMLNVMVQSRSGYDGVINTYIKRCCQRYIHVLSIHDIGGLGF